MTEKVTSSETVKFLYSYGGKIVPRSTDGVLRYYGGCTRVLAVDRSVSCAELLVKFGELCGSSMKLKCKLPTEDLDVLVSVKSDEELRLLIEEYERVSPESKIRAVLSPMKPVKKVSPSPPSSPMSCFDFPSVRKSSVPATPVYAPRFHTAPPHAAVHRYTNTPRCRTAPPSAAAHRYSNVTPVVGYPVTPSAARDFCHDARFSRHQCNPALRIRTQ